MAQLEGDGQVVNLGIRIEREGVGGSRTSIPFLWKYY